MLANRTSVLQLARLSMPVRRRALRSIWRAMRLAGRMPSPGVTEILKYAIRVSSAEAKRLNAEIGFQDQLSLLEWSAAVQREKPLLLRDLNAITIDNPPLLRYFAHSRQPLIFAPIHMGCFVQPMARLALECFADRPMLILRAREDLPEQTRALERMRELGVDMRFLNVNRKQTFVEAIRFARAGAIIVSFVDLPASYGSPHRVKLFGRPMKLAMGLPALTRLTGASVIPVSVHSSVGGDVVRLGKPFESYRSGEEEKARVAEIIRRHIEESVLAAPEQWHMWPRLSEFSDMDDISEAA